MAGGGGGGGHSQVVHGRPGQHTLMAFLNSSERYERFNHRIAGVRAVGSGMQTRVAKKTSKCGRTERWRARGRPTMG